jgi:outer membrane scaffolding protein for murein synthesis (MipA/OmpV family)
MTQSASRFVSALLLCIGVTPAGVGAELDADPSLPLWELGLGAAAYYQPNYPGSDVRSATAFPFPYFIYRGRWLRFDRGLQGILLETERTKLTISAGGTSLVESDDSDARDGMPDLDRTIAIGPAFSLLLSDPGRSDSLWGRLAVRTSYSYDTDNWTFKQRGWLADARLRAQRPLLGPRLRLSAEAGLRFADSANNGYFYNVSPEYARPGRPAYDADGGYAGARLALGLDGRWNRLRWSVYGTYLNLDGTAFKDSPLLDSHHDFSVGASVSWVFLQSKRRVTPKNSSPEEYFETPLFGL